jgi:predicted PolB exonuclease-like 3'-5' exonuclease
MPHVIVWDIETVPDLAGYAAANGHDGKSDDEIKAEPGEKFPKHIYRSIICIGALIAHRDNDHWVVDALGAPHVGERSEKELIAEFVDKIGQLKPQLVTFNGSSFDLPEVRYRAMVHKVSAAGLSARPYFHRYLMMPSIFVTCCLRLHPERRRVCMSYAGSSDCQASLTPINSADVDRYFR